MLRTLLTLLFIGGVPSLHAQSDKAVRIHAENNAPPFGPLQFRNDSVTIAGVYKNYHHAAGDLFKVTLYDWISGKTVHHTTAIDSSGRFLLKIPLYAETDLTLDDARIWERTLAIPGETLQFEADLAAYEKPGEPRSENAIRFAGNSARFHTEIQRFYYDRKKLQLPDYTNSVWFMQFGSFAALKDTMDAVYRNNLRYVDAWRQKNKPEPRTLQYLRAVTSYEAAFPLTQALHFLPAEQTPQLATKSYYQHIDSMISVNGNTGYLSSNFIIVHRDFRSHTVDVARHHKLDKDSLYTAIVAPHPREKELTELWFAGRYHSQGTPLPAPVIKKLQANVKDTLLLNTMIGRNEELKKLMADEKQFAGTRIVTQFPNLQSPEEILAHITGPYRGKVIYLDIWGTWCSPCREMMQYMPDIKKAYAGKDVVFMYMAVQSPEQVWKKTIFEHGVTGPAVAHLLLPDAMQKIFEEKYRTTGYPAYLLIGKDGQVATSKAPRPNEAAALHTAINKLL